VAGTVLLAVLTAFAAPPRTALAAGLSVDLDQWASLENAWQNGNLNGNNARYPEGGVIPFRLAIEGLRRQPLDHDQLRLHGVRAQGL
jgi:hypothetical protein